MWQQHLLLLLLLVLLVSPLHLLWPQGRPPCHLRNPNQLLLVPLGAGAPGTAALPDADAAWSCRLFPVGTRRRPPCYLSRDGAAHLLAGRHCPASCRAGRVQAETHAARGTRMQTRFAAIQGSVNSKLISRSKTLSGRGRDQHLVRGT